GEVQPANYLADALRSVPHLIWLGTSDTDRNVVEWARSVVGERLLRAYIINGGTGEIETHCSHREKISEGEVLEQPSSGMRAMYLVATSGTTGKPKLVQTEEGSICGFLDWYQSRFALSANDNFSLLSGLGYDPLIRDIFTPLSIGACVVIPEKE